VAGRKLRGAPQEGDDPTPLGLLPQHLRGEGGRGDEAVQDERRTKQAG